jgi:hypothetical protein
MINLNRLEQICIEDKYSNHDNRNKILRDMETGLDEPMELAVFHLNQYFNGNYYESKNIRLNAYEHVCGLSLEELVNEVCILILPHLNYVSIQSVAGQLAEVLNYPDIFDGVRTAAEIITVVCHADLYDILPAQDSESGGIMIRSNFSLEPATMMVLDKMKYLPPLICQPVPLTNNYDSAYLGKQESVILGKANHHNEPLALDALNIASSVKMSLDPWVLSQTEVSKKPLDTQEKLDNFNRLQNTSREVYDELLDQGNEFYFAYKYDKRGRLYSSGYHVNIQSTEYKKALINLADKQIIRMT